MDRESPEQTAGVIRLKHVRRNASFGEAVRLALDSLRGSKLRSVLTLIGIILATATLVAVFSIATKLA